MSDSNGHTGGCICGKVRYTAYGLKSEMHACHCPLCQKWAGGVLVGIEAERVEIEGQESVGTYTSSEWAERLFCKECGTNLIWRLQDGSMPVVTVASLDTPPAATLASELYIDTKPDTYALAGEHKRLTRRDVEVLYGGDGG